VSFCCQRGRHLAALADLISNSDTPSLAQLQSRHPSIPAPTVLLFTCDFAHLKLGEAEKMASGYGTYGGKCFASLALLP
jgi:hypothetical protein